MDNEDENDYARARYDKYIAAKLKLAEEALLIGNAPVFEALIEQARSEPFIIVYKRFMHAGEESPYKNVLMCPSLSQSLDNWGYSSLRIMHMNYEVVEKFFNGSAIELLRVCLAEKDTKAAKEIWRYFESHVAAYQLKSGSDKLEPMRLEAQEILREILKNYAWEHPIPAMVGFQTGGDIVSYYSITRQLSDELGEFAITLKDIGYDGLESEKIALKAGIPVYLERTREEAKEGDLKKIEARLANVKRWDAKLKALDPTHVIYKKAVYQQIRQIVIDAAMDKLKALSIEGKLGDINSILEAIQAVCITTKTSLDKFGYSDEDLNKVRRLPSMRAADNSATSLITLSAKIIKGGPAGRGLGDARRARKSKLLGDFSEAIELAYEYAAAAQINLQDIVGEKSAPIKQAVDAVMNELPDNLKVKARNFLKKNRRKYSASRGGISALIAISRDKLLAIYGLNP